MASSRKKLSRKELVQQDEITNWLEDSATWVVDHPRPLLWGIAAVIVVVIAATGWTLYARSRNESAQTALGSLIRTYHDLTTFESDEARYQETLIEAAAVEDSYGSLRAGRIARYYEALAHEGLGEMDEAILVLEELSASSDPTIRPIARFALGQAYKEQGDFDRAIGTYQELLESGEYSAPAVLFQLGELQEAADRPNEAESYYESLVAEHPGSVYEDQAQRALKRLRSGASEDL